MIGVIGAGAFGSALAISLGREGHQVTLLARTPDAARLLTKNGCNNDHLPGVPFPDSVSVTSISDALIGSEAILLAVPMQSLSAVLGMHRKILDGAMLIACCKGVDLRTLKGATGVIAQTCPSAIAAVLTGPSFAADIAKGLPTALTIACDDAPGERLQHLLSTPSLRLYRTTDVIGAELGGALKNVIAIAAGVVIGAGLGDSARAALMTRGYAEMLRFALGLGARAETLSGLSGLGDLVLTCTSLQSRNLRFGISLGSGAAFDPKTTVEGVATARAVVKLAEKLGVEMPISAMVAALIDQVVPLEQAISRLMSRPLKQE